MNIVTKASRKPPRTPTNADRKKAWRRKYENVPLEQQIAPSPLDSGWQPETCRGPCEWAESWVFLVPAIPAFLAVFVWWVYG